MSRYLKSVMKVMPVIQARQLTLLLEELRAEGDIRDAAEYEAKLRELASLVNAETPSPTFTQLRAIAWHLCSSEAHNYMMRAAKNDIEALFLQIDELGQRLDDQHFLLMQSIVGELEHAIAQQEDTIRQLQLMGSPHNEFRDILLNSFGATTLKQINRSSAGSGVLFFNNRTGQAVTEDDVPSAYVSENGKKLVLPTVNEPKILPVSAELLTDSDTYGTVINASVYNDISNVIDGTLGTFWSRTLFLDEPVPRVGVVIYFELGRGRDINYAIIQGACAQPFYVTELWGVAPDGRRINLMLRRTSTALDSSDSDVENPLEAEVEIDGKARIDFEQTFVKGVQIKFSFASYHEEDLWVDNTAEVHKIYSTEPEVSLGGEDVVELTKEILLSEDLVNKLDLPEGTTEHINNHIYNFALDNVWFGDGLYTDSAMFVSEPIHVVSPGVVSVQTVEKNVGERKLGIDEELALGEAQAVANAGSVEYELIRRRNLNEGGIQINHFPIPFLGQNQVIRERLVLTKRINNSVLSDAGALRFCPLITPTIELQVWKNDQLMGVGIEASEYQIAYAVDPLTEQYQWVDNFNLDVYDFSNWTLPRQQLWILINNPSATDVYTVNYRLRNGQRTSYDQSIGLNADQCVVYMNDDRTIRMEEDGKVMFVPDLTSGQTQESDLFVQITLRRNTSWMGLSPEVNEFALLVAPYE